MATVALLALVINRVVRRSDRRLASARGIAEAAQRAVLPVPPARIAGLDVAARYVAAERYAAIGGDLYAVQDTPHGVRLIVGDVRGKGLRGRGGRRGPHRRLPGGGGAGGDAGGAGGAAGAGVAARGRPARAELEAFEGFTTAVLGEIPRGDSTLRLINRGHPAPLLLPGDGEVRALEPETAALPLGMGELGAWPDRVTELRFPEDATLLLFTDGVTEARDRHGTLLRPRGATARPPLHRTGRHARRAGGGRRTAHGRGDLGRHGTARGAAADGGVAAGGR